MTESNSWGGGLTRRQLNDPASTAEANSWGGGLTRAQKNTPAADTEANTWGGRLTRAQLATPGADTEANTWGGPITLAQWQNPGVISEANSWGGRLTRLQLNSIGSAFSPATVAWLAAVEAADGQPLEPATYAAMGTFADYRIPLGGACCLMAGARTLAGALVPMVGAGPTAFNFVSGDYNRTTGLVGDGITKYLDSNRNNNADGQDSCHQAVFASTAQSGVAVVAYIGAGLGNVPGATHIGCNRPSDEIFTRSRSINVSTSPVGTGAATGLIGSSRASSSNYTYRVSGASAVSSTVSEVPLIGNVLVFNRITSSGFTDARLSYYSIGPDADLEAMDTAITTCMNALAAAAEFSPATIAWLAAVEAADGQPLEPAAYAAMGTFADYRIPLGGACCLMAGARTLAGALVPMVGAAPTAFNFVSGDYNRVTGLVGNGSTKYLDSNRAGDADAQDSFHVAVYADFIDNFNSIGLGSSPGRTTLNAAGCRLRSDAVSVGAAATGGFTGGSRSSSSAVNRRVNGTTENYTIASDGIPTINYFIFARNNPPANGYSLARLSYYSIGPDADLESMETAITTCMNALATAGI